MALSKSEKTELLTLQDRWAKLTANGKRTPKEMTDRIHTLIAKEGNKETPALRA
jgi:hypothetical protein